MAENTSVKTGEEDTEEYKTAVFSSFPHEIQSVDPRHQLVTSMSSVDLDETVSFIRTEEDINLSAVNVEGERNANSPQATTRNMSASGGTDLRACSLSGLDDAEQTIDNNFNDGSIRNVVGSSFSTRSHRRSMEGRVVTFGGANNCGTTTTAAAANTTSEAPGEERAATVGGADNCGTLTAADAANTTSEAPGEERAATVGGADNGGTTTTADAANSTTEAAVTAAPIDERPSWQSPKQMESTYASKWHGKIGNALDLYFNGHRGINVTHFMELHGFCMGEMHRYRTEKFMAILLEHEAFTGYTIGNLREDLRKMQLPDLLEDIEKIIDRVIRDMT